MSTCRAAAFAAAAVLFTAGPASAHALYAEARLRGDTVTVEVFYSDNTPARDAAVSVRDKGGQEVASGRTDDEGRWSFPRPAAGKYAVTADAGAGHRVSVPITIPTDTVLKTHTPAPDEVIVTGGPTREELTRFPWLRAALGVAAIGGLAALLWLAKRGSNRADPSR
jgi:nickel transport protein